MPPQSKPEVSMGILLNGGKNTRTGAIGRVVPKAMFRLGKYNVMHWMIAEKLAAGIKQNMIVTPPDQVASGLIEEYFMPDPARFETWRAIGDGDQADELEMMYEESRLHFEKQPLGRAGTGIALDAALRNSGMGVDEFFEVSYGDDLFWPKSGERGQVASLKHRFEQLGQAVLTIMQVDPSEAHKYGIPILGEEVEEGVFRIKEIEEKPEMPKSTYAQFGSQILQFTIRDYIYDLKKTTDEGEVVLATAVSNYAQDNEVYGVVFNGRRFDTGSRKGVDEAYEYYLDQNIDQVRHW